VAIVDERGSLTFDEVRRRTNALARAWGEAGVVEGDGVAILCRNHRGLVEAAVACSKLGAHALLLNTAFAAPQVAEVCAREQPRDRLRRGVLGARRRRPGARALRRLVGRLARSGRRPAARRARRRRRSRWCR
jgi:non-ribosomal peptide synthetase component E (peptide arylation enzyme)